MKIKLLIKDFNSVDLHDLDFVVFSFFFIIMLYARIFYYVRHILNYRIAHKIYYKLALPLIKKIRLQCVNSCKTIIY